VHDWRIGQAGHAFVGADNYIKLLYDERFQGRGWRGRWSIPCSPSSSRSCSAFVSALVFHRRFPLPRASWRGVFILPMMATPVAVGLVWTMMFHPQLGVLNYLLSLVGIPPSLWVFDQATVIPSLVLVENLAVDAAGPC